MDVYLVSSRRLDCAHQNVYETKVVCGNLESARRAAKSLCSDLDGLFNETVKNVEWEYDVGGDHPVRVTKTMLNGHCDLGIEELCAISSQIALEHGWKNDFPTQSLLTVTEIAEAVEEFRDHRGLNEIWYSHTVKSNNGKTKTISEVSADTPGAKPEGIPVELGDAIIRICDWCGQNAIDLLTAIRIKVEYNRTRPFRHGGKAI